MRYHMPFPVPELPPCQCGECRYYRAEGYHDSTCQETPTSRALDAWGRGRDMPPMSPEQRQWCLDQIRHYDRGSRMDGYAALDDRGLAIAVQGAWSSYIYSKGFSLA